MLFWIKDLANASISLPRLVVMLLFSMKNITKDAIPRKTTIRYFPIMEKTSAAAEIITIKIQSLLSFKLLDTVTPNPDTEKYGRKALTQIIKLAIMHRIFKLYFIRIFSSGLQSNLFCLCRRMLFSFIFSFVYSIDFEFDFNLVRRVSFLLVHKGILCHR